MMAVRMMNTVVLSLCQYLRYLQCRVNFSLEGYHSMEKRSRGIRATANSSWQGQSLTLNYDWYLAPDCPSSTLHIRVNSSIYFDMYFMCCCQLTDGEENDKSSHIQLNEVMNTSASLYWPSAGHVPNGCGR